MLFTLTEVILDKALPKVLEHFYMNVASYIAKPLSVAVGFHALWQGVLYLRGRLQVTLPEIGWMLGKAALIATLATQWQVFNVNIFGAVWEVYQGLGAKIFFGLSGTLGSGVHVGGLITGALKDVYFGAAVAAPAIAAGVVQAMSSPILGTIPALPLPQVGFVMLEVLVAGAFFASLLLLDLVSKLMLLMTLMLAPIFIGCYLFEATRPIADSWTRTLLGLMITPACIQVALGITFPVVGLLQIGLAIAAGVSSIGASTAAMHATAYIVVYGGLGALLLNVPSFASGLVGSMAGGTGGYVGQHVWGATAERQGLSQIAAIEARAQGVASGQANPGAANVATMQAVHNPVFAPPPQPQTQTQPHMP